MNIGTGREVSVNELATIMSERAGVSALPVHAAERPGDVRRNSLDPERAAIHLGWKPWTSLAEGAKAVLDHMRIG